MGLHADDANRLASPKWSDVYIDMYIHSVIPLFGPLGGLHYHIILVNTRGKRIPFNHQVLFNRGVQRAMLNYQHHLTRQLVYRLRSYDLWRRMLRRMCVWVEYLGVLGGISH